MPLYGVVAFYWFVDANRDNWPQEGETLHRGAVTPDLYGQAIHKMLYIPTNQIGTVVVLSVRAEVYSPGYNLPQILDAKKSVTVS